MYPKGHMSELESQPGRLFAQVHIHRGGAAVDITSHGVGLHTPRLHTLIRSSLFYIRLVGSAKSKLWLIVEQW